MASEMEAAVQPMLGKWKLDGSKSEKFEEFLALMGANFLVRKMANSATPVLTISVSDGKLIVKNEAGFRTRISELPLDGSETEDGDGSEGKSKTRLELVEGKVTQHSKPLNPKQVSVVTTREVVGTELIQMMNAGEGKVICKRVFIKQ